MDFLIAIGGTIIVLVIIGLMVESCITWLKGKNL